MVVCGSGNGRWECRVLTHAFPLLLPCFFSTVYLFGIAVCLIFKTKRSNFRFKHSRFFRAQSMILLYIFFASSNNTLSFFAVDTRRPFNVYKTTIRRRRHLIDAQTTLCVYWNFLILGFRLSTGQEMVYKQI